MGEPGGGDSRVGLVPGNRGHRQRAAEQDRHHAEDGDALADAADHCAEGVGEPHRNAQDEHDRKEIGEPGRVFERVRAVPVEKR